MMRNDYVSEQSKVTKDTQLVHHNGMCERPVTTESFNNPGLDDFFSDINKSKFQRVKMKLFAVQ